MLELTLNTSQRTEMRDITSKLRRLVRDNGWGEGALLVFSPHTTAGLTINEAADPDVAADITDYMNRLVPQSGSFAHAEGNSDAHIKTSLFGPHVLLPVSNGDLRLGTWQGVYFCEGDGPRKRTVWVQFLPGVGG
jgi:secondary thiamine-phosphate synthase enzyme